MPMISRQLTTQKNIVQAPGPTCLHMYPCLHEHCLLFTVYVHDDESYSTCVASKSACDLHKIHDNGNKVRKQLKMIVHVIQTYCSSSSSPNESKLLFLTPLTFVRLLPTVFDGCSSGLGFLLVDASSTFPSVLFLLVGFLNIILPPASESFTSPAVYHKQKPVIIAFTCTLHALRLCRCHTSRFCTRLVVCSWHAPLAIDQFSLTGVSEDSNHQPKTYNLYC